MFLFSLALLSSVNLSGPGFLSSSPAFSDYFPVSSFSCPGRFYGIEIPIDTGPVLAFASTASPSGKLFACLSGPDTVLKIYRSDDAGSTWEKLLGIPLRALVIQLEILTPKPDSGYIYVFILDQTDAGDLWLLRINPNLSGWETIPVALGSDTIDRFTVAMDKSPNYYLYCLYVNQRRMGLNGKFTRSLDCGLSWETPQDFYNCLDPSLYFGSGSVLHCIWRFALNSREIHYTQNRHFGAPSRWDWLRVLYAGPEKCFDPQVVQAETIPPWRAPIWASWTIARRDTEMLDIAISYSADGGNFFAHPVSLGEPFIDEWWPALAASPGTAHLIYNAGGRGDDDPTVVYYRYARSYVPELWSSPLKVNNPRVNAGIPGARPRVLPEGAFFAYYGYPYPQGLYFYKTAFLNPNNQTRYIGQPVSSLTEALDITGRRVRFNHRKPLPGVYFVLGKNQIRKILILK